MYNKIISVILSLLLFETPFSWDRETNVVADNSRLLNNDINGDSIDVNYSEDIYGNSIVSYNFSNGDSYTTVSYDNEIRLYDINGELIGYSIITGDVHKEVQTGIIDVPDQIPNIINSVQSATDYDEWRNYGFTHSAVGVSIDLIGAITSSAITALITSALLNEKVDVFAETVALFVGANIDLFLNHTTYYFRVQWSYNKYCSILVKERLVRTTSSGSGLNYGSVKVRWLSSPWAYGTCEAACRVLTEIY